MSGHTFVWRMHGGTMCRTFILHDRLIVTMFATGSDAMVQVNHYASAKKAAAYMMDLTERTEADGFMLEGVWTRPAPDGSEIHMNLRSLFLRHLKDARGAAPLVNAVADEVVGNGKVLS